MAMTPEKFNELLRENLKDFITREEFINGKNEILNSVDEIKKKFDNHETEHVSNIAAHERMQGEINETRKKVGLEIKSKAAI